MTNSTAGSWLTCNGPRFRELARAGLFWLEKHQHEVNALNVFPVPDGDTGTNMLLTMRSAWRAIQDSGEAHAGRMSKAFARGALMGARGNSGVILSQIWRGLSQSLEEKAEFDAQDLAEALKKAVDTAYGGVMKPVEGTILTVIRESAEEARDAAGKSQDIRFVFRRTLTRARQSLEKTPDLLPILKQAGVVDSGGQGLVYVFEGMYRMMMDELPEIDETAPAAAPEPAVLAQQLAAPEGGLLENHYDVQFILIGRNLNVEEVRSTIDAMGDSTVVVGDDQTIKVHVHVEDPGRPISYGISLGELTDVVIENMQMQMDDIIITGHVHTDASAAPIGVSVQSRIQEMQIEAGHIAVVAVSPGEGFTRLFKDLGAAAVVPGGQTNNPSTEEILAAIESVATDKIILLPNNKNIQLACEAARGLADHKTVTVVPTRTVPEGIGAMLALNPTGSLEDVVNAMQDLVGDVLTVQVTKATRSVELNGVAVEEGNFIAMVGGDLVAAGLDLAEVVEAALAAIEDIDDKEILTLYHGADVSPEEAAAMADQISEHYPDLEIEVQSGGQAHYFYIMGLE